MKEAKALSLEQALKLLPEEFGNPTIYPNLFDCRRNYLHTSNGNIVFRASRDYSLEDGDIFSDKTWWTSVYKDSLGTIIQYVVVALGFDGIAYIPAKEVLCFANAYNVPMLKFGRVNIRLRMEHGKLLMYQSKNVMDITKYFIPAK